VGVPVQQAGNQDAGRIRDEELMVSEPQEITQTILDFRQGGCRSDPKPATDSQLGNRTDLIGHDETRSRQAPFRRVDADMEDQAAIGRRDRGDDHQVRGTSVKAIFGQDQDRPDASLFVSLDWVQGSDPDLTA
jgi:hypothetical protein